MRRVRGIQGNPKAVTRDVEDNSIHAKLACVEPCTDVHTGAPGLHSGINLCSVFCSETHGQSGVGKNQHVFKCRLISSQWRHPHRLILPRDMEKNGEGRRELWHGASHDMANDPMGLHFSSDSENKVEKLRKAGSPACVNSAKCVSFLECNAHRYGRESRVLKNQSDLMNTFLLL